MKTIKQLGALVKRQNPEYADMTDEQVGIAVKRKHPEDYADFVDESTLAKVGELMDFYNPSIGRLTSWWRQGKAESRVALLRVISEEQQLVIQQGALLAEQVHQGKVRAVQFEEFLARHQMALFQMMAQASLIEKALAEGYTVENHQRVKLEDHSHELGKDIKQLDHEFSTDDKKLDAKLRIKEADNTTDNQLLLNNNQLENALKYQDNDYKNQIEMASHLSTLKIQEAKDIGSIELQHRMQEWAEKVRLAMIAKDPVMAEMQKRVMVQELIDRCYEQIGEIQMNTKLLPDIQQRMINDREEMISFFKGKDRELLLR